MSAFEPRQVGQQSGVEPAQALRFAMASLEAGASEPRTLEGAKVHALESIAWSLAGLLSDRLPTEQHQTRPRPGQHGPTNLSGELRGMFGLNEPRP